MNERMIKENTESGACARAEDLVTYLYGEASEREAYDFRRHAEHCSACRDELTAFSRVREGVVEWRNLSLPAFEFSQQPAPALSEAATKPRAHSALRALREFFALSPMWMRAATAVAVLAVCALVVFTVVHFSQQPQQTVVQKDVQTGPTQAQIEVMANKRAEELRQQEKRDAEASAPEKSSVAVVKDSAPPAAPVKAKRAARPQMLAKQSQRAVPNRVNSSQEARQQLAELVQNQKEEDNLPRLSDLIDDSN